MTYLGYSRVSRVGDRGDRLISPELQQTRIRSYADGHGIEVEMLAPELDVSGGTIERPILEQALERVDRGEAEGIIVAQLDRLSRAGIIDTHKLIERIEGAGGKLIAVAEAFDDTTPEGRMGRNIMLSLAELQLDRYKAGFKTVKRRAVREGIWPMPRTPVGYRLGEDRRLVPDEDAPKVRAAFEARADGAPWSRLSEMMKRGSSSVARMIGNPVYRGEIRLRIGGELAINASAHEAIVSRDLWMAAQQPKGKRFASNTSTRPVALLQGVIRCGTCRKLMSPERYRDSIVYRCHPRMTAGGWKCPKPAWIRAVDVEPHIERTIRTYTSDITLRVFDEGTDTDEIARQLEVAENELATFQEAVSAADLGVEAFSEGLRSRGLRVRELRNELANVQGPGRMVDPDELGIGWNTLDGERKRHLLCGSIGVVWVFPDKSIRLVAPGFEPADLPRPGFRAASELMPVNGDLDGEVGVIFDEPVEEADGHS